MFNKITDYYVPNYECYTVPTAPSTASATSAHLSWHSSWLFPTPRFNIDHLYWLGDDQQGYRVATRWSLIGTHEGPSMYRKPPVSPSTSWV